MRALLLGLLACSASGDGDGTSTGAGAGSTAAPTADVTAVTATGAEGAYTFAVTIASDETGCDQYADWWEVIRPEGDLLYRRILDHSHPDDQPFTRTGGPVAVLMSDLVVVRAHLHPSGYVGEMMQGSVVQGFTPLPADLSLFPELAAQAPTPEECLF